MFATVPDAFAAYLRVLLTRPGHSAVRLPRRVRGARRPLRSGLRPRCRRRGRTSSARRAGNSRRPFDRRDFETRSSSARSRCVRCSSISGGVLLRGARRLQNLDVGFRSDGIVQVYPPRAIRERVIERLRSTRRRCRDRGHGSGAVRWAVPANRGEPGRRRHRPFARARRGCRRATSRR